jgi:hypothetical protein
MTLEYGMSSSETAVSLKHSPIADQAIPGKRSPVTPSVSQSDADVGARLTRGILYGLPISTLFWLLIALTIAAIVHE